MNKLSIAGFTNLGFRLHSRDFDSLTSNMSGKTVVITGATGGLGLESAKIIASLGAHVVIVGRNPDKLSKAAEIVGPRATTEIADLSLLEEVRMLGGRLLARQAQIDVLVNNVGVLLPDQQFTSEGLDAVLATDVAGHFLLTNILVDRLAESGPGRVVNVSSGGMYAAKIEPDDLEFARRDYTGTAAYASAKRAQVILTEMWAERVPGSDVVFHSMHPGWAKTAGVSTSLPTFNKIMQPLLRTPEQGADTIVWLAVADRPTRTSGEFWFDRKVVPTHLSESTIEAPEDRDALWATMVELTGSDIPVHH